MAWYCPVQTARRRLFNSTQLNSIQLNPVQVGRTATVRQDMGKKHIIQLSNSMKLCKNVFMGQPLSPMMPQNGICLSRSPLPFFDPFLTSHHATQPTIERSTLLLTMSSLES